MRVYSDAFTVLIIIGVIVAWLFGSTAAFAYGMFVVALIMVALIKENERNNGR